MSSGEKSGVDLARIALRAAMAQARKNGGHPAKTRQPRPTTVVRRDGREPLHLGAAIGALVTERAWELPAAGATLRERWATITPDLAGHVAAVSYDHNKGLLTVCPESPAWATKVRLEQTRIIAAANTAAGRTVVRALSILPPGSVLAPEPADAGPAPAAAPTGPERTRQTASDGYRRALAAHQAVAPPRRIDPAIAEAAERQMAAMRALSRKAFPDDPDDPGPAPIEQARTERRRQANASHTAALRRARADRAAPKASGATPAPARQALGRSA
jgi:predicted nucleic acid-binding Zn ribbon protein